MLQTFAEPNAVAGTERSSTTISAAKVHVLQLDPIKQRVGDRWPRLSLLVHKLVHTALQKAQGPRDHFESVGELAYIATFHNLNQQEADAALADIVQKVCEKLWGAGVQEISVRSVVGEVPMRWRPSANAPPKPSAPCWSRPAARPSSAFPARPAPPRPAQAAGMEFPPRNGWIKHVHELGEMLGIAFRFAPVWKFPADAAGFWL